MNTLLQRKLSAGLLTAALSAGIMSATLLQAAPESPAQEPPAETPANEPAAATMARRILITGQREADDFVVRAREDQSVEFNGRLLLRGTTHVRKGGRLTLRQGSIENQGLIDIAEGGELRIIGDLLTLQRHVRFKAGRIRNKGLIYFQGESDDFGSTAQQTEITNQGNGKIVLWNGEVKSDVVLQGNSELHLINSTLTGDVIAGNGTKLTFLGQDVMIDGGLNFGETTEIVLNTLQSDVPPAALEQMQKVPGLFNKFARPDPTLANITGPLTPPTTGAWTVTENIIRPSGSNTYSWGQLEFISSIRIRSGTLTINWVNNPTIASTDKLDILVAPQVVGTGFTSVTPGATPAGTPIPPFATGIYKRPVAPLPTPASCAYYICPGQICTAATPCS